MTINVNDVETVGSATFTGSGGGYGYYDLGATGDLIIQGTVSIQDGVVNDNSTGVWAWQWPGVSTLDIASGGALEMIVSGSGSSAMGFNGSVQANFINDGVFLVQSGWQSIGVYLFNAGTFASAGSFTVVGGSNGAEGLVASGASGATTAISNSGPFSVSSSGAWATGFELDSPGTFTNTGTITVTNTSGPAFGILEESSVGGTETIVNSGTITAATAITGGTQPGNIVLTNSGTINGDVFFGFGPGDYLRNTGAIDGIVAYNGTGSQIYDGRGGTQTGGISFATGTGVQGTDIAYLGNDGESLNGGSAFLIAYGGSGNDTMTGGSGGAFLTGGGGNDSFFVNTGPTAAAETIAFRVATGSDTIVGFSGAAGDMIDLSALGYSWADVQAHSALSGSNTVISLPDGLQITLVGLTSLQASDFVFGTIKVLPTDDFAIAASVAISSTSGPLVQFTGNSGGTLTNNGSMTLAGTAAPPGVTTAGGPEPTAVFVNNGTFAFTAANVAGAGFGSGGAVIDGVTFDNNGAFSATISDSQFNFADPTISAYIPTATGATGDVVNTGSFSVQGVGQSVGVFDGNKGGLVQNQLGGTMSVSASGGPAFGVEFLNGGEFDNAGTLAVSGSSQTNFVSGGVSATKVVNSGSITVTGVSSSYGVQVGGQQAVPAGAYNLTNSGTITAPIAIYASQFESAGPAINNSGTLNGDVDLWSGSSSILNTGVINGNVNFDSGTNNIDSSTGAIHGTVFIASAGGTVSLGAEDNTVIIGAVGADVIDGGGGTNTLSFTGAASDGTASLLTQGVTASLAVQGQAQNTGGAGTITFTHFQKLIGSAFNDTLEGGGSASSSLTGGLGADTFVYHPGDGAVTVTDFSAGQGDVIDLSRVSAFPNLVDVLAASSQVGSDTVITIGSGSLRLDGVSMASLTASDFIFAGAPTTVTGSAANNFTATFEGVYRQYTAPPGGAAVTGGPEDANASLANIHRIQFTDGYLAYSPTDTAGQVYRLYEATLNRAPDQEGLTNWVNELNSGVTLQTVANGFVGSQEFQADYGPTLSNSDFVTLLYQNVLHRAPDAPGLANWVGYLTSGQDTRAQVVLGFSESPEDITDFTPQVQQGLWVGNPDAAQVARLYDAVLGREPDAAGLANWTSMLENGTSLQTVANGFVGSQEFQTVYGGLSNTGFVTLLYGNVLHRAPDPTGLNNWVNALNGGESRAQVVLGFSESPEHMTNLAPHIDSGIWVTG